VTDLPKGTPVIPSYERIPVPDKPFASDIKCRATGAITERRWWSGCDEQKIKDAILLLVCTDMGFSVSINAPAYKVPGAKNEHSDHSVLSIIRTGYGSAYRGPKDYWTVAFNGVKLQKFDDPEKAIEFFMQKRMEYEIGEDMAEMNFSGSGCPARAWTDEEEEAP
jgi:hypothetical protein